MALSPGIPTSFVPRQPVPAPGNRRATEGTNIFFIVALFILGVAVLSSVGVFAYQRYLDHVLTAKASELAAAQAAVNKDTVEDFVRLRDRLSSGKNLLNNHVMLSQFFDVLEDTTLQNVQFNTLTLTVAGDNSAKIDVSGTAKNFNALAAQSNAFAAEKRIKRAIFSGITLGKGTEVSFDLSADIDPRLIVAGTDAPAPVTDPLTLPVTQPAPVATTTTPVRTATTTPASTTPAI